MFIRKLHCHLDINRIYSSVSTLVKNETVTGPSICSSPFLSPMHLGSVMRLILTQGTWAERMCHFHCEAAECGCAFPWSSLPLWPNLEWSRVEMAEPYDESSLDPWVTPGRGTLWRTTWSALNFIGARGKLLLCCTDKTLICYVEIARAAFDSFFSSPSLSFLQKILIGFSSPVYWFLFFTSGSQGQ